MKTFKCVSCGKTAGNDRILGLCRHCQDYIIDENKRKTESMFGKEADRYQQMKDELHNERIKMRNAKIGLDIAKLIKKIV